MFLTLGSLWESATSRRAATPPVNKDLDGKLDIQLQDRQLTVVASTKEKLWMNSDETL